MPGIFSRINKARDARQKKKDALNDLQSTLPPKPKWDDAYTRPSVDADEIEDLVKCCTEEIKARGLDHPFLLLPFRPTSNPSAVRTFIRNFFDNNPGLKGEPLIQELRMYEPMVLAGIIKWCWSRLTGGVVSWDVYELFKVGELDSNMARDSFKTFIPLSVENDARQNIIFSFFDLLAAIAAHGKSNGFGGRKLSRMAAWWAFEQKDTGNGFDGGYKAWAKAADATTHLFFAYLRSLSPEQTLGSISMIPRSLEKLLGEVNYPPQPSNLLVSKTNKLVMIVDSVSPTPFALLRRTSHFQYRDSDVTLQRFSQYEDPVSALTEECVRVLNAISAANQSQVSSVKHSTNLRDASWSRFEDIGFSSNLNEDEDSGNSFLKPPKPPVGLRSTPATGANDLGRPTTPSWADFLSAGFNDENAAKSSLLLPPDKVLPPIDTEARQKSSQSHHPRLESEQRLEPGELASITALSLDDAFWWVWMSSLAQEETAARKSAFGRCAVVETKIGSGEWLVLEEIVTGAAPEPEDGAYMAEKKSFFSWTKRSKTISRRKSVGKHGSKKNDKLAASDSKTNLDSETQAKIHAKAVQLRSIQEQESQAEAEAGRRGRLGVDTDEKVQSTFNLQPQIAGEATSALKWVKKYDKGGFKDSQGVDSDASTRNASQVAIGANGTEAQHGTATPSLDAKPNELTNTSSVDSKAAPSARESGEASVSNGNSGLAPALDVTGSNESAPVEKSATQESVPPPPPKDQPTTITRSSSGMQNRFNQAKEARENRGLRKLFSRKNRSSKLPESYSGDVSKVVEADNEQVTEPADLTESNESKATAPATDASAAADGSTPNSTDNATEATESNGAAESVEPTLTEENLEQDVASPTEASVGGESLNNTAEDSEAKDEFNRFDQGPLADQPAFVPDSDDNDGEVTPPVDHKETSLKRLSTSEVKDSNEDRLSQSAGPGVQDRWAQIRKNAANRAAQRPGENRSRGLAGKTSDGDDETSGEETIESRVARIKARVAELTGNMEGTSSPSPTPSKS